MESFALVKIKATVATGALLFPADRVDKVLEGLRDNLKRLGLAVMSIERVDVETERPQEAFDGKDPCSLHGRKREQFLLGTSADQDPEPGRRSCSAAS